MKGNFDRNIERGKIEINILTELPKKSQKHLDFSNDGRDWFPSLKFPELIHFAALLIDQIRDWW